MPITFENDNDVIVYALERVISYARDNQYIFLAQSVWWISSIVGLQQELILHIDNLMIRKDIGDSAALPQLPLSQQVPGNCSKDLPSPGQHIHPSRLDRIGCTDSSSEYGSVSTTETDIHNEVMENCELFLQQSKRERKAIGHRTRQDSRIVKRKSKPPVKTFGTQTEGIDGQELRRRKAAGECQCCAWPRNQKRSHKTSDCFRWKRLEKGTAPFPKKKQ